MDIEIIGGDPYGNEAYEKLFDDIMSDLDKAVLIDRVQLTLEPETPLFIFSIVLRAEPAPKTVGDVATVRIDVSGVHVTITQERYAPDILRELWRKFGRKAVDQKTRFDLDVYGAKEEDVSSIVVASGEDDRREIMAALWRTMPEGIKNRKTFISGSVITVVATEEILLPEMIERGMEVHKAMGGKIDV